MGNRFIIKMLAMLIISGVTLFAFSCKPTCNIKIPKGINPIDWVNYNDVYTFYWNYVKDCSAIYNDRGKYIKVSGWIFQGGRFAPVNPADFYLIDNEANIFALNSSVGTSIMVKVGFGKYNDCWLCEELTDLLKIKFTEADITKKCFVRGRLDYFSIDTMCCHEVPIIIINDIDDIYFE